MKKNIVKHTMMILAFFAISSNAVAQLVWDGTSSPWTHGTGTETDPYLIETPQNLSWLSDMVNNGLSNYSGVYFKQTEDFNMNGDNYQFNVIGSNTNGGTYFSGHYDGNFKSISNLVISDLSEYVGLFGNTRNATLKRICVNGISHNESNKRFVGSICGRSSNDTIIQCSCIGDVVLTEASPNSTWLYIGGLVGYVDVTIFEQCSMRGNVKSARYYCNSYIGGLTGYMHGTNNSSPVTMIKSCYFIGNVIVTGNSAPGEGDAYKGLLVGRIAGASNSSSSFKYNINHCYAVGGFNNNLIDDVMGGKTSNFVVITSSFNSYSGTNLPSTSSYATYRTDAYMKSAAMPALLNSGLDSTVFYYDSLNVNDGYPIFWYQKPVKYRVNTTCDATMGTVSGMGSYASGSTATLQAEAAEGYLFTGWSDGNIENPRTVTVTSDSTYTANFTKNAYTIHVKQDCSVSVQ